MDALKATTGFSEIIVPIDGSDLAEEALHQALLIASATGSPVRLLMADWTRTEGDEQDLQALAGSVSGVTVETQVIEGDPVLELPAFAAGLPPDALVVMASHGRTRVGSAVFGSMTRELATASAAPVIALGPNALAAGGVLRRLVVGVSPTEPWRRLVATASDVARRLGLGCLLVTVVSPDAVHPDDVATDAVLRAAAESIDASALPVTWDVIPNPDPVDGLLLAAGRPGDLLAVATRGETGMALLAHGSTAAAALHRASVPVLLVPAHEEPPR
jgi:nucleotide-binding universal stress UspA family protein